MKSPRSYVMRLLFLFLLAPSWSPQDAPDFSGACLETAIGVAGQSASVVANAGGYASSILPTGTTGKGPGVKGEKTSGKIGHWMGYDSDEGRYKIDYYPENMYTNDPSAPGFLTPADITNCTPKAIALLCAMIAHELLHQCCGGHSEEGDDCAGVSIDIGVADALCEVNTVLDNLNRN